MSKYKRGDMVTIVGVGKCWGNDFEGGISNIPQSAQDMVGKVCEVEEVFDDGDLSIYTPDKSDSWAFAESELSEPTEIKPKPPQKQSKEKSESSSNNASENSADQPVEVENQEGDADENENENEDSESSEGEGEAEQDEDEGGDSEEKEDDNKGNGGSGGGESNYMVISNPELAGLIQDVNRQLGEGFEVVGAVVIARHLKEKRNWYYQTIVKKEK